MTTDFKERLFPLLPQLAERFGTPFHIYDETGIRETGERLKDTFAWATKYGFQEFFAVKALPNPAILNIMDDMNFGFDCSSIPELRLARQINHRHGIMFTSNNTTVQEFKEAIYVGKAALINLDDLNLIEKFGSRLPETICFRYNPGPRRTGNAIIGDPKKQKFGITHAQLVPAYRKAKELGAEIFGLHTMVCSNERNYRYMVETARSLLEITEMLDRKLAIRLAFINIGGGIGIPYRPTDKPFNLEAMSREVEKLFRQFKSRRFFAPALYMESGRFMTGPHGALVCRAINRKDIYEKYVGVDTGMPALMRPAMYGAYHHISVVDDRTGQEARRPAKRVHIVGSICENCDRLTPVNEPRLLPDILHGEIDGDLIVVHDTGAHGSAMGFNYNGRLRPQELLLKPDSSVELIRRAETIEDLFATLKFVPNTWENGPSTTETKKRQKRKQTVLA